MPRISTQQASLALPNRPPRQKPPVPPVTPIHSSPRQCYSTWSPAHASRYAILPYRLCSDLPFHAFASCTSDCLVAWRNSQCYKHSHLQQPPTAPPLQQIPSFRITLAYACILTRLEAHISNLRSRSSTCAMKIQNTFPSFHRSVRV